MTMQKIRLAVVGLGHRGRNIFRLAAEGFDFIEPVAACDIIEKNWYEKQWLQDRALSEVFPQTEFYRDYAEMLEKADPDAVIVETGADIHADFCRAALDKNINVLSDIPIVANLTEADFLWKAAQKSKAIISVGANPNEARYTRTLFDLYKKGYLGKIYCMEAEYIHWSLPDSITHRHLNENGDWRKLLSPIRYCTHSLGPLLTVIEEDLSVVSSFGTGQHAAEEEYSSNKDDMVCAQFQTDSGVVVRLMRNGRCRAKIGHHSYRVFGTEGYFERIDQRGSQPATVRYNSTIHSPANDLIEMPGMAMPFEYQDNPKAVGHGGMDYAMLDRFFKALLNKEAPPISLKEGLRMTIPGIYAEKSTELKGKVLKIKYPWQEDWKIDW